MMKKFFNPVITSIIILFISISSLYSADINNLKSAIPMDPTIVTGTLDNGLKYFIKKNGKPENKAELRLFVNAGAIDEDDDQVGLAHFSEHMLFNGTRDFPKNELINFLESTGMRFGGDVNASTGFDRTVYMLTLPVEKENMLENGFKVLQNWLHYANFDPKDIDDERGVILSEWRSGLGAQDRLFKKSLPKIFYNSRYADRLPIGDTNIIINAPYSAFTRYYKDWYRPDLSAVVAVGDFDIDEIKDLIVKYFGSIPKPENPREKVYYDAPDFEKTIVAIETDKELSRPSVSIYFGNDPKKNKTLADYREEIADFLLGGMVRSRLSELTEDPNTPFLSSPGAGDARYAVSRTFYTFSSAVKSEDIKRGLKDLLTEIFRIKQHGFNQTELDRQKQELSVMIKNMYDERDKTDSRRYASEIITHLQYDTPLTNIEFDYEFFNKYIETITLDDIKKLVDEKITDDNRIVVIWAPEKEGIDLPTEDDVLTVFNAVSQSKIDPYVDQVSDRPLFDKEVKPGKIVEENEIDEAGITELKLSNGITVVVKPTDFKNNEILFTAYSPGGTSLVDDKDFISASYADAVVNECGLNGFSNPELEKLLAGKTVGVTPYIDDLGEGFNGSTTPDDLETALQLINLYFTAPYKNNDAYQSFLKRSMENLENQLLNPMKPFGDTIQTTLSSGHFRARPMSTTIFKELNFERAFEIYKERFADAGDFTFFFVGNVDMDKFKPMIEKYLGSLPNLKRNEKWKDVGIRIPKGKINKEVYKGMEPQGFVFMTISGDFDWTVDNRIMLSTMREVLNTKLREKMREDKGGVYGVQVSASPEHYPNSKYTVTIFFVTGPERVDELIADIKAEIKALKENVVEEKYLANAKEVLKSERDKRMKENNFWLNIIYSKYYHKEPLETIFVYDEILDKISLDDIKDAAKQYLSDDNIITIVRYQEGYEKASK